MILLTGDNAIVVAVVSHQTGDTTCLCSVPFVMPSPAGVGAYPAVPVGEPGWPAGASAWPFVPLTSPRLSLPFFFFPSSPVFDKREIFFFVDEASPLVAVSEPLPLRSDGAAVVGAGTLPGGGGG